VHFPSHCGLTPIKPRRKALTLFGTTQARSSVVEHYIDTVGVGSSILPAPTVPLEERTPSTWRSATDRQVGLSRCEGAVVGNGVPNTQSFADYVTVNTAGAANQMVTVVFQ
jgi:hypothetical protein